jgi:sortase A
VTAVETTAHQPAEPDEGGPPAAPPRPAAPSPYGPLGPIRRHTAPPPARPPMPAAATAVIQISVGVLILAVWTLCFTLGLGGLQAARSQVVLYDQLRTHLADGTAPIGGAIDPGSPVALIEAPTIDLRYVVVEGTAPGDLRAGPGHRRDTVLPGQAGTSVIYGRSTTFGGPFGRISELQPGARITVTTEQGSFFYRVDDVRHVGDPLPDLLASGAGRLTLATAEGVSWRDKWAPDRVVYVDATLLGTPQPTPAGRPSGVSKVETAMQYDPLALVPTVLWLFVLAAGCFGAAWMQARWGGAQAWLVCMPVILAALWGASESASQLLPNIM